TDANKLAAAKLIELGRLRLQLFGVALVRYAHDRLGRVAKPLGDFFVQRHQAGASVHHEQHDARLIDSRFDLAFDLGSQVIDILDAHAAGIDQLEETAVGPDQRGDPVTRHAGRRINDGNPPPGQPVEQRRFADVGTANDSHYRYRHVKLRFRDAFVKSFSFH